jgi:transposase
MPQRNDLSRSLVALDQSSTLIAVIEMSRSSWLVAGIIPGVDRHPLKKLEPDQESVLRLLRRWQDEAARAGKPSAGLPSHSRLVATASGSPAGSGPAGSRRT